MKKPIYLFKALGLFFIFCILIYGCGKKNDTVVDYNEIISSREDLAESVSVFSKEFNKHITIEIDEATVNDEIAVVEITQPDLTKAFEDAIAKDIDVDDESFLIEVISNLDKYSITEKVNISVIKIDDRYEIKSTKEIDDYLLDSVNDFLMDYILKVDFTDVSWEEAE